MLKGVLQRKIFW